MRRFSGRSENSTFESPRTSSDEVADRYSKVPLQRVKKAWLTNASGKRADAAGDGGKKTTGERIPRRGENYYFRSTGINLAVVGCARWSSAPSNEVSHRTLVPNTCYPSEYKCPERASMSVEIKSWTTAMIRSDRPCLKIHILNRELIKKKNFFRCSMLLFTLDNTPKKKYRLKSDTV